MAVIYMLQTVFTTTYAVVVSVTDITYRYSSIKTQRQSAESLAGP